MLRKAALLTALLLLNSFLVGFTPLQAVEFEFVWWYGIVILVVLLIPLLIMLSIFAGRDAPPVEELQAAAEKEEAALAEARKKALEELRGSSK